MPWLHAFVDTASRPSITTLPRSSNTRNRIVPPFPRKEEICTVRSNGFG